MSINLYNIIEDGYRPQRKPGQPPVNQTLPPQGGSGVPPKEYKGKNYG